MPKLNNVLEVFNPTKKQGLLLLALNAAGMIFAAASNTFAIAKDKNTKQEDKKILVPAGVATGVANIGAYYAVTARIIKNFEKKAVEKVGGVLDGKKDIPDKTVECPKNFDLIGNAKKYAIKKVEKAQNGKLFGLLDKKSPESIGDMTKTYFSGIDETSLKGGNIKEALKDAAPTKFCIDSFQSDVKAGAGVLGAFAGAVISCAILTPIIRDVSAYFVQKKLEKNEPDLQNKPYRPYFDPAHIGQGKYGRAKQPLSMQSYMTFTNGTMKI